MVEIGTIYGQLESFLGVKISPAPDEWDRIFNIDFYLKIQDKFLGFQIRPARSGQELGQYPWDKVYETSHERFKKRFGGQVFVIYYMRSGKKKEIYNVEVIKEIQEEIDRLKKG